MSRTITLTIVVPSGAKWMTTDEDGEVWFWRVRPEQHESFWNSSDTGAVVRDIHTGIPCPEWRDSLVDLTAAEGAHRTPEADRDTEGQP